MQPFSINKQSFIQSFLQPVNKVSDQCVITLDSNKASCIVADMNNTMFLYCETQLECNTSTPIVLNIGDTLKLQKAIDCIEEDSPQFELNTNNIHYKSKALKFKFHLLDDGIISKPTIDINKLSQIKIDTSFIVSRTMINNILKNSSFTFDSNKVYFYTKDGSVYCELNDKTMPNIDSIDMCIADEYAGNEINIPLTLRLDWIRCFSGIKFDNVSIRYNDSNKIVIFHIETDSTVLKYVVSGLTK